MTTPLDAFLKTAWNDHGDRPQDVADRLAASLHLVQAPDQVRPYVALVSHVYGEHLGQWQAGQALLAAMRRLPAYDGSAAVAGSVDRGIATLRYASGDAASLQAFAREDQAFVLASAAAMFAGRGEFGRAIDAYAEALRLAAAGLAPGAPAIRALAIGGNNLAAALEDKTGRDSSETRGMVAAAEGALRYWKQAGTWLEEERAEYRLTRSLLQADQAPAAVLSAQRCIAICERNEAPPFERFFGHAVLALAHRAAGDGEAFAVHRALALGFLEQLPQDQKAWCDRERKELACPDSAGAS